MNENTARNLFALLCALAAVAVGVGAQLEVARFRRARREVAPPFSGDAATQSASANTASTRAPQIALVSPQQFKLRLLAALLWIFVLALLAYSVTAWWPHQGNLGEARRFAAAIGAVLFLIFIALCLLAYDVVQVARARTLQAAQSSTEFAALLREEAAKLRQQQAASTRKDENA